MSELSNNLKDLKNSSAKQDNLNAIAELLDRNNIELSEIGKLTKINVWQQGAKDADGELIKQDLVGIQISPKWEAGPEWPVVQQAAPVIVQAAPAKKLPKAPALLSSDWKTAVVLPDPQIGCRVFEDGSLDWFNDFHAMDVAMQVTATLQANGGVDQVVNLGDFLDLPQQGRFDQEAAFSQTTQKAIDAGHTFLAQQRQAAPDAKIILLEGNHDRRMQRFITNNAMSSFGLKQANAPESWPVMSLPYLLRLDELDVHYIDAYPAGMWWINDRLRAIHGDKVRSNGSTAAAWTNEYPHISTIFGHIHRQEIQSKTTFDRMGKIKSMAISPGCLCRVDGAVPSVKGSTGIDGKPATYWENWQQGLSVVTYKDSGSFHVELVHIDDGKTLFRGQEFTSNYSKEIA